MTVIRPNSVSGITSITAQANEINVFRSDGALAGLQLNGVNFNTTAGVSTFATLNVTTVSIGGTLTYEDVTNVDSVGIVTARTGIKVLGGGINAVGVVTATSFSGSGANLTGIDTDLVSDTSPQLGGDLASNSHDILFADNDKAIFGTGSDLKIYHNGSHNYFLNSNGDYVFDTGSAELARLTSNGNLLLGTTTDTQRLHVYNGNGGTGYKTALFDSNDTANGTRVVITNSGNTSNRGLGIMVGGNYAGTDRASFGWFNNNSTFVTPNLMTIQSDGKIGIGRNDPVNFVDIARGQDEENILLVRGADNTTEYGAMGIHSGNCVITGGGAGSTNTGIMFRTAASGNETNRLLITSAGNVEPATDDTYDFGSLTKRWANIYTADLNLSNEGKANDVDGTWGQYTIQEGQDDLYLINKRNGKKYKFLLQEVT